MGPYNYLATVSPAFLEILAEMLQLTDTLTQADFVDVADVADDPDFADVVDDPDFEMLQMIRILRMLQLTDTLTQDLWSILQHKFCMDFFNS